MHFDMGAEWNDLHASLAILDIWFWSLRATDAAKREWRLFDVEHLLLRMFWTWEQPLSAMAFATARAAVLEIELQDSTTAFSGTLRMKWLLQQP